METSHSENYIFMIYFIVAAVLGTAFLSLLFTSLAGCRRARLRILAEDGGQNYIRSIKIMDRIRFYQTSLRAGMISLEILSGCLAGIVVSRFIPAARNLGPAAELLLFAGLSLLSGAVFFIIAETIPRAIARSAPEKITAAFSRFIIFFSFLTGPLLAIHRFLMQLTRRFLPGGKFNNPGMTEDELRVALLEGEKSGIVESRERTMVEGVFYLGDRPAGTFMTHRSEIEWLDINDSPEKVRAIVEGTGQQYFPVAEGDLDEVCGILDTRELLLSLLKNPWPGLKALMRPPCFVPETMPALKTFETFKKAETGCLFVMDEYGGFAGILSVENLIEEIVGQVSAGAGEGEEIIRREDGSWLADGSLNIDTAAQVISLPSLADDEAHADYHTLAGFVLNLAGEIPKTGASFNYHGFRFIVVDLDGNRIDKVMIEKIPNQESAV